MNILILNGSPKGKNSVTVQTPLFLEKQFPEHEFTVVHVGQRIRSLEKNFGEIKEQIQQANLILFTYPVYTFLAPYQMHRFIELMKENLVSLEGKYTSQISTSKHFYDVTAHKYIEENCLDMQARSLRGFSADMEDLLTEKGRNQATTFFKKMMFDIKHDIYTYQEKKETSIGGEVYQPKLMYQPKTKEKDVVIVSNTAQDDVNLKNMIDDFKAAFPYEVREINIREFPFAGGCLGCFGCSTTAKCVYKDGFDDYLRNEIQTADSIVYAYTIENHYTHSSFKCYDDRQFCNGHRTVTVGMPVGYIISGEYSKENNVRTLVEARSQAGGVYLSGVATDEGDTTKSIQGLSDSLTYALTHEMDLPTNFYGVGGSKIFRDLVYLMQGMMPADHKFYKKNGIYDFPQKKKFKILQMKLIGAAVLNPKIQKKMKGHINQYIVAPYTKVIEESAIDKTSK